MAPKKKRGAVAPKKEGKGVQQKHERYGGRKVNFRDVSLLAHIRNWRAVGSTGNRPSSQMEIAKRWEDSIADAKVHAITALRFSFK